jgi:hypothetical protein
MKNLLEIEYEKIFRPETMASLKGKSGESLKQMLGNKSLMQTIMRSQKLIPEIIEAESPYHTVLEGIAVDMVTQAYPIIDYANIRIDAKIVTMGDISLPTPSEEEDPTSPNFGEGDLDLMKAKRRIINGVTQGASIRGAFAFYLFKEYLDLLDDTLVAKYGEILKLSFGVYDSEEAIAMILAMIAQNQNMPGGESQMEYDEEAQQFVIKAKAICFPMLVHEIIKGLYEIVGTQGFGKDKEQNKSVIGAVDKLSNEPRDFQYGKFIYDALNNLYVESNIDDARVRELFFTEVYKLGEEEFVNFIENLINNKLTTIQKQWAVGEMKAIEKDLKKDDTGLEDLDEYDVESSQDIKEFVQFMREYKQPLHEAEYHGRKVQLGKPMQGDVKKFKVYVKNPKGKVVKVNFGFGGSSAKGERMNIKKNNPKRRKAFRARHNCDSPGPRTKARYWSCRKW